MIPPPPTPRCVRRALSAALCAALGTAPCAAQESDHFRYEFQAGLEASDNRLRTPNDRVDDLLLIPRVDFSLLHSSERVQSRGSGRFEFEQSLDDGVDEDFRARMAAAVDVAVLPQRLYWTFQDYADIEPVDVFATDSPSNRQQTNVWLTGPALLLGNDRGWSARAEALYSQGKAEATPEFDHARTSLALALQRRTDAVRAWSFATETGEVDFDQPDAIDFVRSEALLRFDNQTPRLGIDLAVGHGWINYQRLLPTHSRPLARATLRWTPTGSNELRAHFAQELSDAGRDLAAEIDIDAGIVQHTRRWRIGADVYRLRSGELEWQHRGVRSEWEFALFAHDYDYLQQALMLDRDSHGARIDGRILINPRLALLADFGSERFEFDDEQRRDRDTYASLQAEQRLAPRWMLRAGLAHYRRSSDASGADFRENVLSLFLVYAGGAR